jgi:hypothetical protein
MIYLLVIPLLIIFFQDLKMRAVHWFLFPLTFALSIIKDIDTAFQQSTFLNIFYLFLILVMLTIYKSIQCKRFVNISKGYFSLGDILFLLVITPLFSTNQYIGFIVLSSFYALLMHLILIKLNSKQARTIPFAGYSALLLIGLILFKTSFI